MKLRFINAFLKYYANAKFLAFECETLELSDMFFLGVFLFCFFCTMNDTSLVIIKPCFDIYQEAVLPKDKCRLTFNCEISNDLV